VSLADEEGVWVSERGPEIAAGVAAFAVGIICVVSTGGMASPGWLAAAGAASGAISGYGSGQSFGECAKGVAGYTLAGAAAGFYAPTLGALAGEGYIAAAIGGAVYGGVYSAGT
jgi:hypothetical protein